MEYLNLYDRKGNLLKEKGVRGEKHSNLVGIAIIFIENSNTYHFLTKKNGCNSNFISPETSIYF